uniref:RxLR effector candidate protein n=1 Tax=Hyaloperonospora arabidopsidis (strain Emoy2) TaxID=559515 RepID=M4BRA0_HYAAE
MTKLLHLLVLIAFARSGARSAMSDVQPTKLTTPDEDQATQSVHDGKRMLRVTGYCILPHG